MKKISIIGTAAIMAVVIIVLAASGMPESQRAKSAPENHGSTMVVLEQGWVDRPGDIPNVYYSLVQIRGKLFLFLSSGSSEGGVSAIQVIGGTE